MAGIFFEEHHAMVLHLLPVAPSRVLEIGSGIGKDAAVFAARGWMFDVSAAEAIEVAGLQKLEPILYAETPSIQK